MFVEEEGIRKSRPLSGAVAYALDMLLVQAYKTHLSVFALCELAHIEDAATLARRLLELSAQAAFMLSPAGKGEQQAARYLADLWDRLPVERREALPVHLVAHWEAVVAPFKGTLSPQRPRWGPPFKDMFEAAGMASTYEEDYRFLSGIAHGSAEDQILHYSARTVNVRPSEQVPTILVVATRYYLSLVVQWNNHFQVLPEDRLLAFITAATA
jgi:hypothetical protein